MDLYTNVEKQKQKQKWVRRKSNKGNFSTKTKKNLDSFEFKEGMMNYDLENNEH